jgi:hypothetical protein
MDQTVSGVTKTVRATVSQIAALGGGGSLSVTDGTNTVAGTTSLTFSGATVSGTSPNATVTVSASGSSLGNITVDSHASVPTGVGLGPNDEFEYGSILDTTGARYSGATPWVVASSGATQAVTSGNFYATSTATSGGLFAKQAIAAGSSWQYVVKTFPSLTGGVEGVCLTLYNSANTNALSLFNYSPGTVYVQRETINASTGVYTVVSNQANVAVQQNVWIYLRVRYDGTSVYFGWCYSGLGYNEYYTETVASFLGAITHVGVGTPSDGSSGHASGLCDYFRRVA